MGRANPASPTQNPVLQTSLMYWLAWNVLTFHYVGHNWVNSITSQRLVISLDTVFKSILCCWWRKHHGLRRRWWFTGGHAQQGINNVKAVLFCIVWIVKLTGLWSFKRKSHLQIFFGTLLCIYIELYFTMHTMSCHLRSVRDHFYWF